MWHFGRVLVKLDGLIVLTCDSSPLVYLTGSKGGQRLRAAFEYYSDSDSYETRFRHHEVVIHTQGEFLYRWKAQRKGEFGNQQRDLPQTREPTCTRAIETYGSMAENVTTPGAGAFHATAYVTESTVDLATGMLAPFPDLVKKMRKLLDVRKSLAAAGEMTNSVQMLFTNFD